MSGQEFLTFVFAPFSVFALALFLVPQARRIALRKGFVDRPGGRKRHEKPIPPIGGLVIFPLYMLAGPLFGMSPDVYGALFAALALLLVVGAMDDRYHINPWVKFGAQIAAAAMIVIPGGAQIDNLGNLFGTGTFWIGAISVPFCIIATVLLINAINLMDGLDGLAGGKTAVILTWFMIAAAVSGDIETLLGLTVMIGALGGFLFYNMRHPLQKQASVFLGDAGSMCLGLVIAWFSLKMAAGPGPDLAPISVAWILALPIFDTCGQFYRRAREGRHPFSPDRGHFHHHFIAAGLSSGRATATILMIGAVTGGVGYLGVLAGVPEVILTALWTALLFVHMALSFRTERYIGIIRAVFGARVKQDTACSSAHSETASPSKRSRV